MKQVYVSLPDDLVRQLEQSRAENGTTLSFEIRDLVQDGLAYRRSSTFAPSARAGADLGDARELADSVMLRHIFTAVMQSNGIQRAIAKSVNLDTDLATENAREAAVSIIESTYPQPQNQEED